MNLFAVMKLIYRFIFVFIKVYAWSKWKADYERDPESAKPLNMVESCQKLGPLLEQIAAITACRVNVSVCCN